jgi:Sec-independent protein translocase protein TatA
MKWLILLALIVVLVVIIATRYRKQIQMALYVFRMFRKMRQMSKTDEKQINTSANVNDTALVNCAKCGTWIPQNKALKLRSGVFYCSANCLETTAKVV